ncbi:hypothetical protein SAMN02910358_01851 [Lachnospiraceae bacterium XBB1006]|nr:hypothetical protein SAMN02910358_01851 [Lachnospiraceae bacterium XBB1006]
MKNLKKITVIILVMSLLFTITPSLQINAASKYNAKKIAKYLKKNISTTTRYKAYTKKSDPNKLLGRPKQYTGKADFFDTRVDSSEAGTIEVFRNKKNCTARYKYLKVFQDPSLGVLGLSQYMIRFDKAIIRISNDLTRKEAGVYRYYLEKYFGKKAIKSDVKPVKPPKAKIKLKVDDSSLIIDDTTFVDLTGYTGKVKWSVSSNLKITAKLSSTTIEVKGIKKGTGTVIALAKGKKYTKKIYVSDPYQLAEFIRITDVFMDNDSFSFTVENTGTDIITIDGECYISDNLDHGYAYINEDHSDETLEPGQMKSFSYYQFYGEDDNFYLDDASYMVDIIYQGTKYTYFREQDYQSFD